MSSYLPVEVGPPDKQLFISSSRGEVVSVPGEGGGGDRAAVAVQGVVRPALEQVEHSQRAVVGGRQQEVPGRVERYLQRTAGAQINSARCSTAQFTSHQWEMKYYFFK